MPRHSPPSLLRQSYTLPSVNHHTAFRSHSLSNMLSKPSLRRAHTVPIRVRAVLLPSIHACLSARRLLFPPCTGLSCTSYSIRGPKRLILLKPTVSTKRPDTDEISDPRYVPGTVPTPPHGSNPRPLTLP